MEVGDKTCCLTKKWVVKPDPIPQEHLHVIHSSHWAVKSAAFPPSLSMVDENILIACLGSEVNVIIMYIPVYSFCHHRKADKLLCYISVSKALIKDCGNPVYIKWCPIGCQVLCC